MSSSVILPPTFAQHHAFIDSIASPSLDSHIEVPQKKKKKRHREHGPELADDGPEKKKKRKKQHGEHTDAQEQTAVDPALLTTVLSDDTPLVKRKKKKKDKVIQQVEAPFAEPVQSIDDSENSNPQAAAAALISAIVAAATGTPDFVPEHAHEYQSQIPPYMLPHLAQPHYMPYPFNPYPYGVSPFMPSNAAPPATVFPPTMNLPFSEMTFGSNDDVLRALQALDMSKITSVLKTLGDAAAAVSGQSSIGEQARPTPLCQVPVASGAILGNPSNEPSPTPRHKRTLDMSLSGLDYHGNPDHAYILANKWLNASKLSELARTEGLVYKKGKFSAIEEEQLRNAIEITGSPNHWRPSIWKTLSSLKLTRTRIMRSGPK